DRRTGPVPRAGSNVRRWMVQDDHQRGVRLTVVASEAKQSGTTLALLDAFVASLLAATWPGAVVAAPADAQEPLRPYTVVRDAIPVPLTGQPGDPARGRAIVTNRFVGLCLLCHSGPFPEERFQGDLAPDLRGAGRRWSEGQVRLRIVDPRR